VHMPCQHLVALFALAISLALCPAVYADFVVSNFDESDISLWWSAAPNPLYGEIFTPPAGHNVLDGISFGGVGVFDLDLDGDPLPIQFPLQLNAYVAVWTGTTIGKIVASAVFSDPTYEIPPGLPPSLDFNLSPTQLVAGQQYVALLKTVLPSTREQVSIGAGEPSSSLIGAVLFFTNSGWTQYAGENLAMEFRYAAVPEPSSFVLAAIGAALALLIRRRKLRR
jgi:hypothetical protein